MLCKGFLSPLGRILVLVWSHNSLDFCLVHGPTSHLHLFEIVLQGELSLDPFFRCACPGLCSLQIGPCLLRVLTASTLCCHGSRRKVQTNGSQLALNSIPLLAPESKPPQPYFSYSPSEVYTPSCLPDYMVFSTPSVVLAPLYFCSCSSLGPECALLPNSVPGEIPSLPQAHLK